MKGCRIFGLTVSSISVWQLTAELPSTVLTWARWFHTKRSVKRCPAGGLLVGSDGWSQTQSGMVELVGCRVWALCSVTAAVLRLSHVLSHGVAMFGELVRGGGLWRMGTGGQGVGDGHSPRHQALHRSGNPTGGYAHHTRREPAEGEEANKQIIRKNLLCSEVTTTCSTQLKPIFVVPVTD